MYSVTNSSRGRPNYGALLTKQQHLALELDTYYAEYDFNINRCMKGQQEGERGIIGIYLAVFRMAPKIFM